MTPDLAELKRIAEAATPGSWRRQAMGGSSTVLAATKPPRNDTRIPPYGYKEEGAHCLAYPFLDDDGHARLDFVCFSHEDAAHVATFDPPACLALIAENTAQAARIEALEAGLKQAEVVADSALDGLQIAAGWASFKPDSQRARDKIRAALDHIRNFRRAANLLGDRHD